MDVKKEIHDPPASCEIVSSRVIHSPAAKVFKAWTEPALIKNWWGPKGFTNTFHEFNPEPGGRWYFTMHGPDGKDYKNECVFIIIEEPSKLVWNHVSGPKFQGVATFNDEGAGRTKVTYRMIFRTAKECNAVKALAVNGNEENFDRLEKELEKMK